jgi:hypothetical protein
MVSCGAGGGCRTMVRSTVVGGCCATGCCCTTGCSCTISRVVVCEHAAAIAAVLIEASFQMVFMHSPRAPDHDRMP